MINEPFSNSEINGLETFGAPSENTACSPEHDAIATKVINVRMPSSCNSAGGESSRVAEMSINFCMPKDCLKGEEEKFVSNLTAIVKVGEQGYILKSDGTSSDLKLGECVNKLKALLPRDDIAFLGGKIIATCKNDSLCNKCVEAVDDALPQGTYASELLEVMYSSNIYENTIV